MGRSAPSRCGIPTHLSALQPLGGLTSRSTNHLSPRVEQNMILTNKKRPNPSSFERSADDFVYGQVLTSMENLLMLDVAVGPASQRIAALPIPSSHLEMPLPERRFWR